MKQNYLIRFLLNIDIELDVAQKSMRNLDTPKAVQNENDGDISDDNNEEVYSCEVEITELKSEKDINLNDCHTLAMAIKEKSRFFSKLNLQKPKHEK